MFLNEVSLFSVSWRQYVYKLKGYTTLSLGLIFAQMIALLGSLGGVGSSMSSSGQELTVSVRNYSGNAALGFTFVWLMVVALTLTTKLNRNMDFTLIANRLSNNLSNIGFLLTACVFGGITASLSGVLLRVVMYFGFSRSEIITDGFYITYSDLMLGMALSVLYMLLVAASGYLMGVLTQINMIFAILIPALIFGLARVDTHPVQAVFGFYAFETGPLLFALKIIITSSVLFGLSVILSNRMEVRE